MHQLYRRTLEQVRMPEGRSQALRQALASRCAERKLEGTNMNKPRTLRRPALLVITLLAILALTVTAFAAGTYVTYRLNSGEPLPAGDSADLLDSAPDAVLPYEGFSEAEGEVTVTFTPEDWEQAN